MFWIYWVGVITKFITWQSANQSEGSFQSEFREDRILTKNMFCLRNERSSVIGSIRCLWNQSNRSPTSSSYFCQWIVYRSCPLQKCWYSLSKICLWQSCHIQILDTKYQNFCRGQYDITIPSLVKMENLQLEIIAYIHCQCGCPVQHTP